MPKITKKDCWDILEDKLVSISENRLKKEMPESRLAISVIVSAGRECDIKWLKSSIFSYYCKLAYLHELPTRYIILHTLEEMKTNNLATLKKRIQEN